MAVKSSSISPTEVMLGGPQIFREVWGFKSAFINFLQGVSRIISEQNQRVFDLQQFHFWFALVISDFIPTQKTPSPAASSISKLASLLFHQVNLPDSRSAKLPLEPESFPLPPLAP